MLIQTKVHIKRMFYNLEISLELFFMLRSHDHDQGQDIHMYDRNPLTEYTDINHTYNM